MLSKPLNTTKHCGFHSRASKSNVFLQPYIVHVPTYIPTYTHLWRCFLDLLNNLTKNSAIIYLVCDFWSWKCSFLILIASSRMNDKRRSLLNRQLNQMNRKIIQNLMSCQNMFSIPMQTNDEIIWNRLLFTFSKINIKRQIQ